MWVIYHAKRAAEIVQIWARELKKAPAKRKLYYFYLANDVIQNSRKKTQVFVQEFQNVLKSALRENIVQMPEKDQKSIQRIFSILEERKIFSNGASATEFKEIIQNAINGGEQSGTKSESLKRERHVAFASATSGSPMLGTDVLSRFDKPFLKTLTQLNETIENNRNDHKSFENNDKLISECKESVLERSDISEDQMGKYYGTDIKNDLLNYDQTILLILKFILLHKSLCDATSANMSLENLKQLQTNLETMLSKCSEFKFALVKENDKRRELVSQLEKELEEQRNTVDQYNNAIKVCSQNIWDWNLYNTNLQIALTTNNLK